MKRMIDYKEFYNLQQLAKANEQRLDFIEGAYTYSALSLDDANFDHLLPGSSVDLQPQTLRIGDTVYIEGVAATLDADMIKEIFDSNLVILDCGAAPTNYPTVFLQRQYVDEGSGLVSPRNARFKAFVTYGVALFEYTMIVAEYDETSEAGGYIVVSCNKASTKPIYCHPIYCSFVRASDGNALTFTCLIFNNSNTPYTKASFLSWAINFFAVNQDASIMASGYKGLKPISRLKRHPNNPAQFIAAEAPIEDGTGNDYYTVGESELANAAFTDGVNAIN